MGSLSAEIRAGACGLCRQAPPREECFLAVEGQERPLCRSCWEQALLDPRRVARRLRSPYDESTRFRLS
jgi:hypothetical protein